MMDVQERKPKDCVIVAGGDFGEADAAMLRQWEYPFLVAADRGAEHLLAFGFLPDVVIGDLDSASAQTVQQLKNLAKEGRTELIRLKPEKDDTDTEAALNLALERTTGEIRILGGFGSRIDHMLANIQILRIAAAQGRSVVLQNEKNRVRVLTRPFSLAKEAQYGRFVSVFPLTTSVEGLTMRGFYYPLEGKRLRIGTSLGVSNEIVGEKGEIFFEQGELILVESRD